MYFLAFQWIPPFCGNTYNHVTRGPDCGMCCIFSEKQACIARHKPSELFENVFVQAVLSLLASVKLIFSVNKHFGSKL